MINSLIKLRKIFTSLEEKECSDNDCICIKLSELARILVSLGKSVLSTS